MKKVIIAVLAIFLGLVLGDAVTGGQSQIQSPLPVSNSTGINTVNYDPQQPGTLLDQAMPSHLQN